MKETESQRIIEKAQGNYDLELLENERTTTEIIEKIYKAHNTKGKILDQENKGIVEGLLKHNNTPTEILDEIFIKMCGKEEYNTNKSYNQYSPEYSIIPKISLEATSKIITKRLSKKTKSKLAELTPYEAIQLRLVKTEDEEIERALVNNPNRTKLVLDELKNRSNKIATLEILVASKAYTQDELIQRYEKLRYKDAQTKSKFIAAWGRSGIHIPLEVQKEVASSEFFELRLVMAEFAEDKEIIETILKDKSIVVLRALANNRKLETEHFEKLLKKGDTTIVENLLKIATQKQAKMIVDFVGYITEAMAKILVKNADKGILDRVIPMVLDGNASEYTDLVENESADYDILKPLAQSEKSDVRKLAYRCKGFPQDKLLECYKKEERTDLKESLFNKMDEEQRAIASMVGGGV